MTDVPIRVKISSKEAQQGKQEVVRSLNEIRQAAANTNKKLEEIGPKTEKSAKQATKGVNLLKKALLALGGVAVIRGLVGLGNEFGELQNRLRITSTTLEETNQKLERLFKIANANRAPVAQLVALFQKGSIASKELGASQEDMFKFVDLVAKGLTIQGGSAASASGALLQLSQALGSGIVRAEEFNSLLEGAFPIAQAAAKGLDRAGGSVAKLRQLIVDGDVTSKEFFQALLSQSDDLTKTFAKIEPTLRSAGTVFRNNLIKEMESSQGLFGLLAQGVLFLGDNLNTLLRIVQVVGTTMLAVFSPQILGAAIGAITASVKALTVAIAANPIGAIAVAVTAAVSALTVFADKIQLSTDGVAHLNHLFQVVWSDISTILDAIWKSFADTFGPLVPMVSDVMGDIEFSISGILKVWASVMDSIIGVGWGTFNAVVAIFKNLPAAIADAFFLALNAAIQITEDAINKMGAGINALLDFIPGLDANTIGAVDLGDITNKYADSAANLGSSIKEAFLEGFEADVIGNYIDDVLSRSEQLAKGNLEDKRDKVSVTLGSSSGKKGEGTGFADGFIGQLNKMQEATKDWKKNVGKDFAEIFGPGGVISKGIGDAVAQTLVFGKSFKDQIGDIARTILSQLISSLVQVGVNMMLNFALGQVLQKTILATTTATASATATAWAPAAALASLATLGGNAVPAAAAIGSTTALSIGAAQVGSVGFESGGYTGDMGTKQVAGVVHGKEFVVNAEGTRRNRAALEAMNSGGIITGGKNNVNINVIRDDVTDIEINESDDGNIEIIARRVVRQEAPQVIAGDLANPNSKTSKAMKSNYDVDRRRT
jgi:tape measure domain-containing protein